jgi:hypothetical protein
MASFERIIEKEVLVDVSKGYIVRSQVGILLKFFLQRIIVQQANLTEQAF